MSSEEISRKHNLAKEEDEEEDMIGPMPVPVKKKKSKRYFLFYIIDLYFLITVCKFLCMNSILTFKSYSYYILYLQLRNQNKVKNYFSFFSLSKVISL